MYHNPRCSKSRETLRIIEGKKIPVKVIEYLTDILTKEELVDLLYKLKLPAVDIVRKQEPIYKEIYKGKTLSEEQWVEAMVTYPKLIERPIVVKGNEAILGRPPQNVNQLI